MSKLDLIKRKFKGINIFKTIYANFTYFPFCIAIKFPIFVYGKTSIMNAHKGIINITPKYMRTGILNIGTPILGFQPTKAHTVFNIKGMVEIYGKVIIGKGCAIEVGKEGILSFGNNTTITGNTKILCTQKITIGNECMISWDNLIMDTDWHNIVSSTTGEIFPKQKPIFIGNHVWIGSRCTILKGCVISNDSILASNSKITKSIYNSNVLIGSNTILKENVTW